MMKININSTILKNNIHQVTLKEMRILKAGLTPRLGGPRRMITSIKMIQTHNIATMSIYNRRANL